MFDGNSPFVLLDDARACDAAPARLYRDPVDIIRADKMEELEACFSYEPDLRPAGANINGHVGSVVDSG